MRASSLLSLCLTCSALACGGAIQIDPLSGDERPPPAAGKRPPPSSSSTSSSSSSSSPVEDEPRPTTYCPTIKPGQGEVVLACGFPEEVSLVGATPSSLAIASRTRDASREPSFMLHRLARTGASLARLVQERAVSTGGAFAVGFSGTAGGVVVWNGRRDHSSVVGSDLMSIDLESELTRALAYDTNGSNIVVGATNVYWDGHDGAGSTIFQAPLAGRVPSKSAFTTQPSGGTLTVGVALGYVYYFAAPSGATTSMLMRKPESDDGLGSGETLLTGLPSSSELGYHAGAAAVDADGTVYFAKAGVGEDKTHGFEVLAADRSGLTKLAVCSDPDLCSPPAWLELRGDEILVGKMTTPLGWWNGFLRLPKRPALPVMALSPEDIVKATVQLDGDSMGGLVFEGDRFFVAYRRANTSEGVIASRALPP